MHILVKEYVMIRVFLKLSSDKLSLRIKKLQEEQKKVMELFKLGGISREIANNELFKLYKKVEFSLRLYTFFTTLRVKAQTQTFSMD